MTTEVESVFDRYALLKGRAAALQDVKEFMLRPRELPSVRVMLLSAPREELISTVFARVHMGAIKRGFTAKQTASFITGYTDTMMAFARLI